MRDAHGRSGRTDNDPRRRPPDGFRARDARRFRQLASEIPATLPNRVLEAAGAMVVEVEDVPGRAESRAGGTVKLARFEPGGDGGVARLVLYRRALEARATSRYDLAEAVRSAAIEAIAHALGIPDPEDPWDDDQAP
ncbi:MAG TPA: metallopeptidase family protein [Egibacteraceae bacterium]|nr:metallopeptidase family protein [Egibacteraceae bacterium]